jgi:hypothetical protein
MGGVFDLLSGLIDPVIVSVLKLAVLLKNKLCSPEHLHWF